MTTAMQIEVENIKCAGCERSILKGLGSIDGIADLVIDREHQTVRFSGPAPLRPVVSDKLRSMGYPEKGTLAGLDAGLANVKSFVSCAVGRVS